MRGSDHAWLGSVWLSRTIGPYRAKELSLTGNFLSAQQAYDWGLVNRVVEPAELMPAALKLAHEMASIEADVLVTYKAMIDDGYALSMGDGLALEHERSVIHNAAVTPEMVEARRAAQCRRVGALSRLLCDRPGVRWLCRRVLDCTVPLCRRGR